MSADSLVGRLQELRKKRDRGALAALRRGLGRPPGTAHEMHPHVTRHLPQARWGWREECFYIVAALFGLHPTSEEIGNFGETFYRIALADTQQHGEFADSLERRFVALLKSHREDLFDHLRHAVSLAKSKEVPINWTRLLHDLIAWDAEDGHVQRNWSHAFWGRLATLAEEPLAAQAEEGE